MDQQQPDERQIERWKVGICWWLLFKLQLICRPCNSVFPRVEAPLPACGLPVRSECVAVKLYQVEFFLIFIINSQFLETKQVISCVAGLKSVLWVTHPSVMFKIIALWRPKGVRPEGRFLVQDYPLLETAENSTFLLNWHLDSPELEVRGVISPARVCLRW